MKVTVIPIEIVELGTIIKVTGLENFEIREKMENIQTTVLLVWFG